MLLGVIALYVIITLAINSAFLKTYYMSIKQKNILDSYSKITAIDYSSEKESIDLKIELIEDSLNIQVYIIDDEYRLLYAGRDSDDILTVLTDSDERYWFSTWALPYGAASSNGQINSSVFDETPSIAIRTNSRLNAQCIILYARHLTCAGRYNYIMISAPISAIDANVTIYNRFTLFVMMIVLTIGLFFSFIMTTQIMAPFRKINRTTHKLANLNFEDRLDIRTDDEVGQLARSINHMSDQLESKIRELSIANEQLKNDILEKEAIDKMRTELISNVSHELKTPLSIILGYSEAMQFAETGEDRDYYCSIIQDEAEKMSRLACRLLDIAELESGGAPLDITVFDLAALASDRAEKISMLLAENNISVFCENSGCCLAYADANRIEEVINNLLSNAIHHTPENGIIRVTVNEKVDDVELMVYNSGSFIPESSLPHLWESFYKVDKARTRKYGGSGLGLKIVSSILDSHTLDGCKTSYSAENVSDGVVFRITLPKAACNTPERNDS